MLTVLVTDAEQRAALSVVRSLGRAGYDVHVTGNCRWPLAGGSRWARSTFRVSDPLREPQRYVEEVREALEVSGAQVLLPITEASALALLDEDFGHVVVPMPEAKVFRRMCDKAAVLKTAEVCGLRVPRQVVLETPSAVTTSLLPHIEFPVALKPSRSINAAGATIGRLPVRYAENPQRLSQLIESIPDAAYPILVQERIVGEGIGVFHLVWDGASVAACAHRRLREKPPTGGVSTYRESIELSPELLEQSFALLSHLGMTHGVAMVEFKSGPSGNVLMEINPRFWGSLQLAVDAGVDFPSMLVTLATGGSLPRVSANIGVRSRWFWGDIDHLIARVRLGLDRSGRPVGNGRLAAVREVLGRPFDWSEDEVLRSDDPKPFLRETLHWLRGR